ncbi:hypothetical protein PV04_09017 [Phialophora macrospora]|uniref:WSC domain-containing protein n=1 Tax=Phialophora macrospora TaxID=1851006 RepID=A0A0D2DPC7_9EURO|nr:hypothetical protein PV04_09017 [Phialophora macrospora]
MTWPILHAVTEVLLLISLFVLLAPPVLAQSFAPTSASGPVPIYSLPTDAAANAETISSPNSIIPLGCYSQSDPLESQGDYVFQSSGRCRAVCQRLDKPVMATTGGTTCYCGDGFPALDSEVDMRNCNVSCGGYSLQTCGGVGFWQVYLIGWMDRGVGDLRQQWQQG